MAGAGRPRPVPDPPDELAYLMPGGKIDPTGDRAERFRRLLVEWREAVGLPAI